MFPPLLLLHNGIVHTKLSHCLLALLSTFLLWLLFPVPERLQCKTAANAMRECKQHFKTRLYPHLLLVQRFVCRQSLCANAIEFICCVVPPSTHSLLTVFIWQRLFLMLFIFTHRQINVHRHRHISVCVCVVDIESITNALK